MSTSKKVIKNDQDTKKESTYDSSKGRMCFGEIYENTNDEAKLRMLEEEIEIDKAKGKKGKIEFSKDIIE